MSLPEAVCLFLSENSVRCAPLNDRFKLPQAGVLKSRTERLSTNVVRFLHWHGTGLRRKWYIYDFRNLKNSYC